MLVEGRERERDSERERGITHKGSYRDSITYLRTKRREREREWERVGGRERESV